MKSIKKIVSVLGFLIVSGYSFGQIDMSLCKMMIESKNIKDYDYVKIDAGEQDYFLDKETVEFSYNEKFVKITDKKGTLIFIPYDKIKSVAFLPFAKDRYPTFEISLIK